MPASDYINKLESTESFKSWRSENPGYYPVHLLFISGEKPQAGYYNPAIDKMFTFAADESAVPSPAGEVFKENETIKALDIIKVKIDERQAEEKAMEAYREKCRPEEIIKKIIVLQNLQIQLYNITLITRSFMTVNIRINSETGDIISLDSKSLISQI